MNIVENLRRDLGLLEGEVCWAAIGGEGTGSIISLSIGEKIPKSSPSKNKFLSELARNNDSKHGFMIYGAWRVDSENEVISGSHMSNENDGPMVRGLRQLADKRILAIKCEKPGLDLVIQFEGGLCLSVFCAEIDAETEEFYTFKSSSGWYSISHNGKVDYEDNT